MKKLLSTVRLAFMSLLTTGLMFSAECFANQPFPDSTKVLVVGTIHGNHDANPNYTYQDLLNIMTTYQPDAICVEIPESYFRKRSYLKEMMLATMYGINHSIKVYPIDWWAPGDDRAKYNEYIKTEEYKIKEKEYYELEKADSTMQNFYSKYESLQKVWNGNQKSYTFFNGNEYNNYISEMYAINIKVFGDGPMNLSYETRNKKMLEFIDAAIADNKGKKIIVLTGAEHKHYFDDKLSERTDIQLITFNNILPLKEGTPENNLIDFIGKNLAKGYYEVTDSESIDMMYQGSLISLTHGLGMDSDPSIIPIENVKQAEDIISQWKIENPKSAYLCFEAAWTDFLKGNYEGSVAQLKKIEKKLDEIPESMRWFVKTFYYRNLGFCYDMLGKREIAVESYNAGIEMCKNLGSKESSIKSVYKDYVNVPYDGKKQK